MANQGALMLQYGKDILNNNLTSAYGRRKFVSMFGISPTVMVKLLTELEYKYASISYKHVYWACHWLFVYDTETNNATLFKTSAKTYRDNVWMLVRKIFALELVNFNDRFINWPHLVPSCSLDGTHCHINEHHPFNRKYFSHKMNHGALTYEIGLALGCSKIVWWNGGNAAGENPDLVLARSSFVYGLQAGEKAAADKGYNDGFEYFYTPYLNPFSEEHRIFNWRHKKMMARHEMVNKRMKEFKVLRSWRHFDDAKHRLCFGAIINIIQLQLDESPLPPLGFNQ
jgi:hypothetical protein